MQTTFFFTIITEYGFLNDILRNKMVLLFKTHKQNTICDSLFTFSQMVGGVIVVVDFDVSS